MRTANIFHRFHFYCLTSMRMVKRVREKAFSNSSGFRFNVTFVDCTSVFVKSVLETSLSFTYILYGSRQRARRRLACRLYQSLSALVCVKVCVLPMVRCGSSPVARPYHAKNEAPGEEAVPAILNNRPIRLTQCCTQFKSLGVIRFFVYCICIIMWHSHLNDVEIPETKRFIPKGLNWVQH